MCGRTARLRFATAFLTATFLAAASLASLSASEVKAGAADVERASGGGETSAQPAQPVTGDPAELQKALDQEHRRAELLARQLITVRELEMVLNLQKARVEASKSVKFLQQERERLRQVSESGFAELCKSVSGDPAERLVQDLAVARHDLEIQTALAAKASNEVAELKYVAKRDTAELRKSLQEEQERAGRLEQDLASARRDVETQTALAAKATDDASQAKQVAEQDSVELRRSARKEHDRAEALAQELSTAHATIYAHEAEARKASDAAAGSQQVSDNGAATLQKSLQEEQERARRLEQDLAAARRDVETQAVRVAKANEDAVRLKQAAEHDSAEMQRSLQKEHDRAEALAQNLSMMHSAIYTYDVQTRMASDQAKGRERATQSDAAELRKSLVEAWERAARLQQELAAARRDAETQSVLAAKASAGAALKQAADDSSTVSLRSLQQEREKSARLEPELASAKTEEVPAVSGSSTTGQVTRDKQPGADGIKPIAAFQTSTAAARIDAKPDLENAAEVARLMARASVLLGQGAIGSARSVLERAVEAGNAQASFALAETYDPLVLRRWGAYGTVGNAAKARDLYAKAEAGGIKEAKERFDALRP